MRLHHPAPDADAPSASTAQDRPPAHPDAPTIIPHTLHGRAACSTCHGPAGRHPYPDDHHPENHQARPDVACLACHVPAESPRAPEPGMAAISPVTNQYCFSCHANPQLQMTLSSGQTVSLHVDKAVFSRSMHGRSGMSCTACHPGNSDYPHAPIAATVVRELNRNIVQTRCGTCHAEIFAQYKDSVHGKDLIEGKNLDVPSCTDCHGIHSIRDPLTTLFRLESPDTCSHCHADKELAAKYGMSDQVTQTYLNDFHGVSIRLGAKSDKPSIEVYKPVCYDCHGIHDIKKVEDPNSHVVKENLVKTCERCHEGADMNFPAAWTSHYIPSREKWPIVYYTNLFYDLLIPGVIGGMILYILLEITRAGINKFKGAKHG